MIKDDGYKMAEAIVSNQGVAQRFKEDDFEEIGRCDVEKEIDTLREQGNTKRERERKRENLRWNGNFQRRRSFLLG